MEGRFAYQCKHREDIRRRGCRQNPGFLHFLEIRCHEQGFRKKQKQSGKVMVHSPLRNERRMVQDREQHQARHRSGAAPPCACRRYLKSDADTLTAQTVSEEKPARPAPIPEMPERQTPVLAYEIPADPQMPQRISPSGNAAAQTYSPAEKDRRSRKPLRFNVKTNMLYDVVGFPSLEVEIPFGYRWSLNLEGAVAWWSSYKRDNFYQLDLLSPEVRWWFGQKSRWHGHYIGAFGILGLYDLEWKGGRGYQGEYWSAGFSYGYMFPIGRKLSLEAGIGLGFMQTGYEEYLPQDEHYVYQQSSRTNYWGPVKLKLGLVWRIGDTPTEKRKKGRTGL